MQSRAALKNCTEPKWTTGNTRSLAYSRHELCFFIQRYSTTRHSTGTAVSWQFAYTQHVHMCCCWNRRDSLKRAVRRRSQPTNKPPPFSYARAGGVASTYSSHHSVDTSSMYQLPVQIAGMYVEPYQHPRNTYTVTYISNLAHRNRCLTADAEAGRTTNVHLHRLPCKTTAELCSVACHFNGGQPGTRIAGSSYAHHPKCTWQL